MSLNCFSTFIITERGHKCQNQSRCLKGVMFYGTTHHSSLSSYQYSIRKIWVTSIYMALYSLKLQLILREIIPSFSLYLSSLNWFSLVKEILISFHYFYLFFWCHPKYFDCSLLSLRASWIEAPPPATPQPYSYSFVFCFLSGVKNRRVVWFWGKNIRLHEKQTWILVLALSLTSSVTPGKSLALSGSFLICKTGWLDKLIWG